jgi:hypothetical protein
MSNLSYQFGRIAMKGTNYIAKTVNVERSKDVTAAVVMTLCLQLVINFDPFLLDLSLYLIHYFFSNLIKFSIYYQFLVNTYN